MKAFKKWYVDGQHWACYESEKAWRAALEEALKHKDNIIEWIEKELED